MAMGTCLRACTLYQLASFSCLRIELRVKLLLPSQRSIKDLDTWLCGWSKCSSSYHESARDSVVDVYPRQQPSMLIALMRLSSLRHGYLPYSRPWASSHLLLNVVHAADST
jgi:hypothetical protein